MGWMEELLGTVPAAAKYRAELEILARENARLRSENAELKNELTQYIEQWETLDGDAVCTLQYLAQDVYASADAIARTHNMNFQIAEMYLQFLVTHAYLHPPVPGGKGGYGLSHEGRRYLHSRGLAT